ncbi:MAG: hypothetical protein M5T61_15540 [Acidimicrobiia bacterium]|nr:hypothetical protein [Acidimicrobiia bacterium]
MIGKKGIWAFRLAVRLEPGSRLGSSETSLELDLGAPVCTVKLRPVGAGNSTIGAAERLAFFGAGYESQEQAANAGTVLQDALRIASARSSVSIDVGDGRALGGPGPVLKEAFERDGVQLLSDVHGLIVYEARAVTRFLGGSATSTVVSDLDRFLERLTATIAATAVLDERARVGADLLAQVAFERSSAAKHVMATTAGEVLALPAERTGRARELVEELLVQVDEALTETPVDDEEQKRQLQSLRSTLQLARGRSISSRFRDLADELPDAACRAEGRRALRRAYEARSDFVHDGEVSEGLPALTSELTAILGHVVEVRAQQSGDDAVRPKAP